MTTARPAVADWFVALLLAVGASWLYAATQLGCIYGNDGAMLAEWTAMPARAYHHYHNTLYLPAAWLVEQLVPRALLVAADDPLWVAKSLSVVAAALGVAFTFLCCRWLGASRLASIAGTVLLAVSPVLWFFGASIEVHALHFAIVTFCAWVTLAAPWRRPALALGITALAFVLPCLSHQSAPVLGPGWILLVQCARRRTAAPFSWRVLFGIGCVLLASLLLGHMLVMWRRGLGFGIDLANVAATVGVWRRPFTIDIVWHALLAPLGLLLPIAVAAVGRRAIDGWLRATAAVTFVPLIGCVSWWGIAEQGGYLLGPAFLLAALAAALWSTVGSRLAITTAVLAIGGQAWAGYRCVHDFDRDGSQLVERVERVRERLGASGGVVLSCNDNAPDIAIWLPRVKEVNVLGTLANDAPLATWFAALQPVLQGLATTDRFLFDVSYRQRADLTDRVRQGMALVEAALRDGWRTTELAHASWPLWLVEKR